MGKAETRSQIKAKVGALSPREREAKGDRIAELLSDLPEYLRSYTVMYYMSLPDEVPTRGMILEALRQGKRVLIPKIVRASRMLLPCQIRQPDSELRPGALGILEPVKCAFLDVAQIDFVVVPGVAFDRSGNRLGRGAGYYDRFLAQPRFRGTACGVAFDVQVVPELPAGRRDVPIMMLVTESGVLRFEVS